MPQLIYTSDGAPTSTPAGVGYINVDTTNDRIYFATGTNSSSDWDIMPSNLSEISVDADLDFGGNYKAINLKGLDFQTFAESTISTGVIAPTQSLVSVDTEADASADDLDTITVATDLNCLFLKMENAARVPTLKHGTGNLSLPNGADVVMVADVVYTFLYDGSNWLLAFDPAGVAVSFPVSDATNLVKGSIDTTKQVRLEADTNTPTATTIVITTPTADLDMDDLVQNGGTGTDNAIPRYNGSGQALQDSGVLIDDSDNLSGVAKISTDDHLELTEIAAPSTPATGKLAVYTKTDGKLYIKDNAGTETDCTGGGGAGSDTTAIHDDTAGEITAITEKTSIAVDDEFLIEDSADSNNKKSLKRSTLGQDIQNTQTGTTYTLALSDASITVTMDNASANTLTIPTNASVAFPTNTVIAVMQYGAGSTTVTGDTGVTVNGVSAGSVEIGQQYSGLVLTKTATNTWVATAGASNDYQYLGTSGSISSAASVAFTTAGWFDGTYKELIFKFIDVLPATDAVSLYMRGSTDGGSTYLNTNEYDYSMWGRSNSPANISTTGSSVAQINMTGGGSLAGSATNEHLSGDFILYFPNSSNHKRARFSVVGLDDLGNLYSINGAGSVLTTNAVDAVQFLMSSGNIASGEILVYGVRA